ncbi:cell division protein FtsQ/DivIB [Alteromonas sediminis]|uniref:cell division protein FtsQ/DivIB n=1 Tax=Alteromonas sediminis TaxID=2259342 RepID=UPI001F0BE947|nr:cell division protein FtsQ/DivIB [Alteromonas sediminis]
MSQRWTAYHWGGLTFLVAVICLLAFLAWQIRHYLQDEQKSPVQTILFSGEFEHVSITELERLIRTSQPGSFFALDVNEVHELIEGHPWVYRASIRKQWPHTLQIYLVEQQPVVAWNADMVLNPFGEAFNVAPEPLELPQLFGPGGSETTALEGYNAMQQLLATSGLAISELSLSERFAWQVQLTNGIRLNLGRQEFMDRLQRFIDVYPLLAKQDKPIQYVDLRYDTGLAVGWQQEEENKTDV